MCNNPSQVLVIRGHSSINVCVVPVVHGSGLFGSLGNSCVSRGACHTARPHVTVCFNFSLAWALG